LPGRGFYLIGNSSGAFDATVTVTLATPVNTKFNACVYASDWPPNATLQPGGGYILKGTPPFIINGAIVEPTHTFGAGTCIYSITDSTGCPGFVVNPPIVTGSILTTGDTVCVGGAPSAITGIAASGGDGRLSYSWYKNGDLIADATGADYTPPDTLMPGVYTYTRKVNDQTCNIMPQASTGSWVLTVGEAPSVTLSAASATVCTGAEVTLTATAGAVSYSFNDGAWQASNTTNVTVNSDATYTVKARSVLGCESAAASTTVAVEAAPTNITLSASSTTVCAGAIVTLTATAGAASYSFNGGNWKASNTTNVTVNANATYTVKAASALGCESAAASATVSMQAAPNVSLSASSTTVCSGTSVTLTATTGADSYLFNSGAWQASNTTTVIVNANATYTVKARSALGCESAEAKRTVSLTDPAICALSAMQCAPASLNLGTVGFTNSGATYNINGLIVSSPVTVTYCNNRTSYAANSTAPYRVDCAANYTDPEYGSLISWCMVMQYADRLCPSPWRVPTRNDFCQIVNGSQSSCGNRYPSLVDPSKDINENNGWVYGEYYYNNGSTTACICGYYWSSTIKDAENAYIFDLSQCCGSIPGDHGHYKGAGLSLRCVQNP
jgi:uncharacterized protein (TIGR02145 family)